jgi:hypothetical protein
VRLFEEKACLPAFPVILPVNVFPFMDKYFMKIERDSLTKKLIHHLAVVDLLLFCDLPGTSNELFDIFSRPSLQNKGMLEKR